MCVTDTGVSRLHAEIVVEGGGFRLKVCDSRFGTFVNGERKDQHVLVNGDSIRLGPAETTTITFLAGDDLPVTDRSAIAAANELRHMSGLLEGLRALGSGRVLDDVLTLVLDAAIDVTGALPARARVAGIEDNLAGQSASTVLADLRHRRVRHAEKHHLAEGDRFLRCAGPRPRPWPGASDERLQFIRIARQKQHLVPCLGEQLADGAADVAGFDKRDLHRLAPAIRGGAMAWGWRSISWLA